MQTWSPAVPSARCLGTARAGTPGQPVLRSSRFTATACKSAAVDSPQKPSGPPVSTAEQSIDQFYDNEAFTSLDLTDRPPIDTGIMLQGFGWSSCDVGGWYNIVKENIPRMKELGITFIWLPPPSESVSPQGYMPGELYKINTPYGTEEELKSMLKALNAAGIDPLADIVINHRCAGTRDDQGRWNIFNDTVEHPGRSLAWGKWAIVGGDGYGGTGAQDSGDDFGPAPDLDHTNEEVRESLKDWLRWLHSLGYQGWRLDYVKGYAPQYCMEYCNDTLEPAAMNVGEYWVDMNWGDGGLEYDQNGPRQAVCDFISSADKALPMFDFPTKGILQEAVKNCEYWRLRDPNNKPTGVLGWWPSKSVTFVDNHDTGSTQNHWPFPRDKLGAGYAYIITHPGMPCLLWEHVFDYGLYDEVNALLTVRKKNELHIRSKVEIRCADHDMYVACIDDKVIIKMGPRHDMGNLKPNKQEGWKVKASGKDYAVWDKQE